MNQDSVKEILLNLNECELDFTVTFTGKSSKLVNGLYKPDTQEIMLHNKNFKSDNQLIYTAIHEYAHHLINCSGCSPTRGMRVHTTEFWALFHDLLDIAETKGIYERLPEQSEKIRQTISEIKKITDEINTLEEQLGVLIAKLNEECIEDGSVRYEDIVDREIRIPRAKVKKIWINKNNKIPRNIQSALPPITAEQRQVVESMVKDGKSIDQIKMSIQNKVPPINRTKEDKKQLLEKEKQRIEKTIRQLHIRLEQVIEKLEAEAA